MANATLKTPSSLLWSETFETALVIEPQFSRSFAVLLLAVHGGALVLVLGAFPEPMWCAPVVAAVVASLIHCIRRLSFDFNGRLATLGWSSDGEWTGRRTGKQRIGSLRLLRYVTTPWMVLLRFQSESGPLDMVLPRDAVTPRVFRQLRARLHTLPRQPV